MRIYILMLISLGISCTPQDVPKLEFNVDHEFRLSYDAVEHIHRMYTTVSYLESSEEFLFTNYQSPIKVVVTDKEGDLVLLLHKEGRGPDEIQSARYLAFSDSQITILDKMSASFKVFDRSTLKAASYDYPVGDGVSISSRNMQRCNKKWFLGIQLTGQIPRTDVPIIGVFNSEFNLTDTLGGYDPFFEGRQDLMQEPVTHIDCRQNRVYSTHGKVPFIQSFSILKPERVQRTSVIPEHFKLSDTFIPFVSDSKEMFRFLSEEQSISLFLGTTEHYLLHAYRNDSQVEFDRRGLNDNDYFIAVYQKPDHQYVGDIKIPGAVLGFTESGKAIVLKDEEKSIIQLLEIKSGSKSDLRNKGEKL